MHHFILSRPSSDKLFFVEFLIGSIDYEKSLPGKSLTAGRSSKESHQQISFRPKAKSLLLSTRSYVKLIPIELNFSSRSQKITLTLWQSYN